MSGVGSNDVLISVWYMLWAWSKQAILFTTKEEGDKRDEFISLSIVTWNNKINNLKYELFPFVLSSIINHKGENNIMVNDYF